MVANLRHVGVYNCNCLVVLNEDVRLIILKMPLSDIRIMIFYKYFKFWQLGQKLDFSFGQYILFPAS